MTASNVDFLSDDDRDFILHLTGGDGSAHLIDEEEMMALHEESMNNHKFRDEKDFLQFRYGAGIGTQCVLNDPEKMYELVRNWLKQREMTLGSFAEHMLGKRGAKHFLAALKRQNSDPDSAHTLVEDLLGKPKEKIEASSVRPGRAWYQEHKLDGEVNSHRPDDGRMDDEVDDFGWKQKEDGSWETTGYKIPYLRENKEVVEINKPGFTMKVLAVYYCSGDKPVTEGYHSLVKLAYEPNGVDRNILIRRHILKRYMECMRNRDESIKTAPNGLYHVYYKVFEVEGKRICVFSPIMMDDLRDDLRKKVEQRIAMSKLKKQLASGDLDLCKEI